MKKIGSGALIAAGFALAGCATICNSAGSSAGNVIGNAIGQKVGDAVVRTYSPAFMNFYYGYIFTLAFNSNGYDLAQQPMKPGEWVKYEVSGHNAGDAKDKDQKPNYIQRAFLFSDKEGNEYWQVKFTDGSTNDVLAMEAEFNKGRQKLLRMKAKNPKETEGQEVPVNDQTYYVPPQKLTKESLKGALVGSEDVTVPAGSFKADHYKFGGAGGGYTQEFWISKTVPGGEVKYLQSVPQDSSKAKTQPEGSQGLDANSWTSVLKEQGTGAVSELGIKPAT